MAVGACLASQQPSLLQLAGCGAAGPELPAVWVLRGLQWDLAKVWFYARHISVTFEEDTNS